MYDIRRGWAGMLMVAAVVAAPMASASAQMPATIEERAAGADRVVVATVDDVVSGYEINEFGDRLIVSHARLAVEELLKGQGGREMTLEYEGGTVDGVTLHVSSLPELTKGDRAVFFVTPGRNGEFRPHLRGQGIVPLDDSNRVPRSSLTLDDIRQKTRGQGQGRGR